MKTDYGNADFFRLSLRRQRKVLNRVMEHLIKEGVYVQAGNKYLHISVSERAAFLERRQREAQEKKDEAERLRLQGEDQDVLIQYFAEHPQEVRQGVETYCRSSECNSIWLSRRCVLKGVACSGYRYDSERFFTDLQHKPKVIGLLIQHDSLWAPYDERARLAFNRSGKSLANLQ